METHRNSLEDKDTRRVKLIQPEEVNVIDIETETLAQQWNAQWREGKRKRSRLPVCTDIVCPFLDLIYVTLYVALC